MCPLRDSGREYPAYTVKSYPLRGTNPALIMLKGKLSCVDIVSRLSAANLHISGQKRFLVELGVSWVEMAGDQVRFGSVICFGVFRCTWVNFGAFG